MLVPDDVISKTYYHRKEISSQKNRFAALMFNRNVFDRREVTISTLMQHVTACKGNVPNGQRDVDQDYGHLNKYF